MNAHVWRIKLILYVLYYNTCELISLTLMITQILQLVMESFISIIIFWACFNWKIMLSPFSASFFLNFGLLMCNVFSVVLGRNDVTFSHQNVKLVAYFIISGYFEFNIPGKCLLNLFLSSLRCFMDYRAFYHALHQP